MMSNVRFNEGIDEKWTGDEVIVHTQGIVTFRVWDIHTHAAENVHMEKLKRLFNLSRKTSGRHIDWDFLLND